MLNVDGCFSCDFAFVLNVQSGLGHNTLRTQVLTAASHIYNVGLTGQIQRALLFTGALSVKKALGSWPDIVLTAEVRAYILRVSTKVVVDRLTMCVSDFLPVRKLWNQGHVD